MMVAWPRVGLTRARDEQKKTGFSQLFLRLARGVRPSFVTDVVLNLEPHCAGQRGPRPKDCAS
jgi:hypothetical protein